jgi:lipooligosaccharide transport system permease protein
MATPLSFRVVEAEARIYRRTWRGSVFTSFLNPVLYLLAMGVGLGTLVDANLPGGLAGVSYVTFLAPGLLVATAMQTGAGEGSWKVMAGIEWQQSWKARLATPIGVPSLALGHLLWATIRVFIVSLSFVIAMASVTTAFTSRLKQVTGLPMFFRFVVVPMFLFSGVFFPITQLPGWLQPVAYITPVFHGVELARDIALGIAPAVDPLISVTYLLVWIIGGGLLIVAPLRRRLTP